MMTPMFATRLSRRIAAALLVAVACASTAFAVRKLQKPYVETAPSYREEGPADAKVVIAEFSDFECPACRAAEPTLRQILSLYKGQVRFIFKDFPLEHIHPFARMAATTAECAGKQGRFWPLHDELYDKQPDWVEAHDPQSVVLGYAQALGVDQAQLKACMDDPATTAAIDADIKEAGDRFVYSTPTFFINGRRFVGARELQALAPSWIDKQLGKRP